MSENMMCPDHKDNKKYRDKFDNIFRKKKTYPSFEGYEKGELPECYGILYSYISEAECCVCPNESPCRLTYEQKKIK